MVMADDFMLHIRFLIEHKKFFTCYLIIIILIAPKVSAFLSQHIILAKFVTFWAQMCLYVVENYIFVERWSVPRVLLLTVLNK